MKKKFYDIIPEASPGQAESIKGGGEPGELVRLEAGRLPECLIFFNKSGMGIYIYFIYNNSI